MSQKKMMYHQMNSQLKALLEDCDLPLTAMANTCALIYSTLPDLNWAGFSLMHHGELVLGPFQGKIACMRIAVGKGVCGTAVKTGSIQRVDDVHLFPGHIACDSASASEIVLPLTGSGALYGVLDIDSPILSRFDAEDEEGLKETCHLLMTSMDWTGGILP